MVSILDSISVGTVELEFPGKNGGLKFSSEEEFFETLGIMCREDRPVKIRSIKSQAESDKIDLQKNALKPSLKSDGFITEPGGYRLECRPTAYYPKAFYDRINKNAPKADGLVSFGCTEYVKYLCDKFKFSSNGSIPESGGRKRWGNLEPPHISVIKEAIGTNSVHMYFFKKGLCSSVKNN
jgi:hypothetical protein